MALVIGPVVALIGVFAAYMVLRTRARDRQSLYAARRTLLEERADERRQRALNPPPPPPAPPPAPDAPMAAGPSAPAEAAAVLDPSQAGPPPAPQPAWDQSPVPAPPPAPAPPPQPEPAALVAPEVPPGWDPQPNPAAAAAAAPAPAFESTAAVELSPAPDLPPAEPAAPIATQPPWRHATEAAAPAVEAPAAAEVESVAQAAAPDHVESPGIGWSIVESGKSAPAAATPEAPRDQRAPAWEIVGTAPTEQEQREQAASEAQRHARRTAILRGVLSYVGLVGALVVVLLGVLLMLATSH